MPSRASCRGTPFARSVLVKVTLPAEKLASLRGNPLVLRRSHEGSMGRLGSAALILAIKSGVCDVLGRSPLDRAAAVEVVFELDEAAHHHQLLQVLNAVER